MLTRCKNGGPKQTADDYALFLTKGCTMPNSITARHWKDPSLKKLCSPMWSNLCTQADDCNPGQRRAFCNRSCNSYTNRCLSVAFNCFIYYRNLNSPVWETFVVYGRIHSSLGLKCPCAWAAVAVTGRCKLQMLHTDISQGSDTFDVWWDL